MEFLDGRPLNYEKDLNKAAKIFGKIHSIELNKEDFSSFIIENNIFSDRIKEANNLLKDFWNSSLIKEDIKKFFYKFINWATENSYKEKYFIDDPIQVINNTEVNSHNFIIGSKNFLFNRLGETSDKRSLSGFNTVFSTNNYSLES